MNCLVNNTKNTNRTIKRIMKNMEELKYKNITNQSKIIVYSEINNKKLVLIFILINLEILNISIMSKDN
jgi:hypothetical protein